MLIKDLIAQLQEIHDSYTEEDLKYLGQPAISIDLFRRKYPGSPNYDRVYAGISDTIVIDKFCGSWPNPVIVSFAEEYPPHPPYWMEEWPKDWNEE